MDVCVGAGGGQRPSVRSRFFLDRKEPEHEDKTLFRPAADPGGAPDCRCADRGGLLALRAVVGQGGLALLEGLFLVHTRFVGDYDTAAVVDAGAGRDGGRTGGPVELLSDCRGI